MLVGVMGSAAVAAPRGNIRRVVLAAGTGSAVAAVSAVEETAVGAAAAAVIGAEVAAAQAARAEAAAEGRAGTGRLGWLRRRECLRARGYPP